MPPPTPDRLARKWGADRAMGLTGGSADTTAKKQLMRHCNAHFRRFDTLALARDAMQIPDTRPEAVGGAVRSVLRRETAVFGDGNILMFGIPPSCSSMAAFTKVLFEYVRDLTRAGHLVVVVFDEPDHMTEAKKEEQAWRDAEKRRRKVGVCSDDMAPAPLGADFTPAQLDALDDVHVLFEDRVTRVRLYDEAIMRVYNQLQVLMETWSRGGFDAGTLLLDGVDPEGASRAPGQRRRPQLVGTDAEVAARFQRGAPIGEGDIKLIALDNRLRILANEEDARFHPYKLAFTVTTDTDSFCTMLLDAAKRRVVPYTRNVYSCFAMREAPTKRAREASTEHLRATFNVCDTVALEHAVQTHLWSEKGALGTPEQMLNAMLAFTSSLALCGCDFTTRIIDSKKKIGADGARPDHFWESLPTFVASEPEWLATFGSALATDPAVARTATQGLIRVCYAASKHMEDKAYLDKRGQPTARTYKKQAEQVWEVEDALLRRAVWASAYWSQNELKADSEWGFRPALGHLTPAQAAGTAPLSG